MVSWTYDTVAKGQLTSTSRFDGATTYTSAVGSYDDGYRPLSATETVPGFGTGGGNLTYTSTFTYKPNGAPATTVLPGVGGLPAETLSYTYTDQGLPKTLTSGQATYVADMTYTYDGMIAEQRLGAAGKQVKQVNVFDAATRRLASADTLLESSPSVFTSKYTSEFAYNNAGLITSIAGKTNGSRDQVECFKYDYLQRLDEAWTNNTWDCNAAPVAGGRGADPYWRKWSFDLVGNRLTQTDKGATADTTWTYQVGAAGAVKPHQVKKVDATGPLAGTATRTFSYDATGNMLSRNTDAGVAQTLTWDKEGHLATLTEGSVVTSYVYDSAGRRLIAKNSAKQTLYLPDGTELEKIGSADPLGTRYYNGVAVRSASGLKWIASNHQQTSTVQIDSVTLAAERRRFMPYGEPRGGQPSGWLGTKGFVDGTKDDTGLTHLGAREYDPTLGRFISRDPVMDLNDPQQIHGYAYSHNSPISFSDASGLNDLCSEGGAGDCSSAPAPQYPDESTSSSNSQTDIKVDTSGGDGGGVDPAAAAKKAAEEAKQKLIDAAKALLKIAMDELGITAALDCFTKGDLGACAETALNVALSFVGGLAGKLLAKYGAPWKWAKGAELVKKVWNLLDRMVSHVKDWIKHSRLAKSLDICNSFVPGTLVLLADGSSKPIEELQVGDVVVATDPATGRTEPKPVTATIVGEGSKNLVEIIIDVDGRSGSETAKIVATDGHPFWAPSLGKWIDATDIQPGTVLEIADRKRVKVVTVSRWSETTTVYNLSISDIHTYYILAGITPVLVHNDGGNIFTPSDLGIVSRHLSTLDHFGANDEMTSRIGTNLANGTPLTSSQVNFMNHELTEARLMGGGMSYDQAHASALGTHAPGQNYDVDLIKKYPEFGPWWHKQNGLSGC